MGDLLITAGCFLLLFVGWQLVWTDVTSDADARTVVTSLDEQFSEAPGHATPTPDLGDAYAIIYIPRFGANYARPLYQGTTRDVLARGVGHYVETAEPGAIGNFSMAGHRTTYGKPFNQIDELQNGDAVLVRTAESWFVYRVTSHEIVAPTDTDVILPVPNDPGAAPSEATFTMTSCHPEFSARERYIVHGVLESTYEWDATLPSAVWEVN